MDDARMVVLRKTCNGSHAFAMNNQHKPLRPSRRISGTCRKTYQPPNAPARCSRAIALISALVASLVTGPVAARTLVADPSASSGDANYYLNLLDELQPGDTLSLPAGTYANRLNLSGLNGTSAKRITITGPSSGGAAVITTSSNCCNLVQLDGTAYVNIKNITVDARSNVIGASLDAVNAKGSATHDILIENNRLIGGDYHQQTVGISTKSTAWRWTIRGNTIVNAGTGIYLGNSNGNAPFVAGLVEGNYIVDSIGYNMQIKQQNQYALQSGMPAGPSKTIIRNNVFIKRIAQADWSNAVDGGGRTSGARPNLLVDGFPSSGPGSNDLYEIYGNFFYQNPDESLFQGSGRIAIHDNVMVGGADAAIRLQNHQNPLKLAYVYNNTIYGQQLGIRFGSQAAIDDAVVGNLVFGPQPLGGSYRSQNASGNILTALSNASNHVKSATFSLATMDFYPKAGQAQGAALNLTPFQSQTHYDRDFNGQGKGTRTFRGAYAGAGANPGWKLGAGLKQGGPGSPGGGNQPPLPAPTNLTVN